MQFHGDLRLKRLASGDGPITSVTYTTFRSKLNFFNDNDLIFYVSVTMHVAPHLPVSMLHDGILSAAARIDFLASAHCQVHQ